jgi:KDO2-lipid IV(A) lauroyltransferase
MKKTASTIGILLLNCLSLFPLTILYLLADLTYYLLYYLIGYRRKVVEENLTNAFPEKSKEELTAISKKYYRHLSSLMVEIIKMSAMSSAELQRRIQFKNLHLMQNYLDAGTGVLGCSAHYGNWEWGTLALQLQIRAEIYPIYKPLSNVAFDNWFNGIRSRFGNHMIPMRQTLRALTESKNRPTIFLFATDQTPQKSETSYWLDFLHQPTAILPGLEKIAIRTNRPIFYLKSKVIRRGYYEVECIPLCMEPVLTKEMEITALHVRMLEEVIREDPAYWLWSHRRWKHKPED